jgi:uncharacterized NAD(P)/FAD-binding protein YdhS
MNQVKDELDTQCEVATKPNLRVAILGGGASGALVATQLLSRLGEGDEVILIHRNTTLCFGIAYGTGDLAHRLNVRGQGMSAFPDRPNHFVDWLVEKEVGESERLKEAFVARRIYGEYLQSVLDDAIQNSPASLKIVVDEAVGLEMDGTSKRVTLGSGENFLATHAVLAIGHLSAKFPPILRPLEQNPRFVRTPWANGLDQMELGDNENILMIGTGLTMVDAAVSLRPKLKRGTIFARSRHGLMPHTHRHGPKPPVIQVPEPPSDIRSLAKEVIRQGRLAGPNWRGVVDGCRTRTAAWWKGLDWKERSRFMHHLTPFWDVHRHRVDDELYAVLKQMQIEERLNIGSGRVLDIQELECGFRVTLGRPNVTHETLNVGWILNCTGPETGYRDAKLPLLETAVASGLASYDPLGLGLNVDDTHQTGPDSGVYAIGPLCRGCLWETIAVPEIRSQAELIAKSIVD